MLNILFFNEDNNLFRYKLNYNKIWFDLLDKIFCIKES